MNKKKIFMIMGESCVGKDSVLKELLQLVEQNNNTSNNQIKLKRGISMTNRPLREGEKNGREYNFISTEEFLKMKKNNEFIEETSYNVNNQTWYYGYAKNTFEGSDSLVVIVNPRGLKVFLKSYLKKYIIPIYICCNDKIRKERYLKRDAGNKELLKQWEARLKQDKEDFNNIFSLIGKIKHSLMFDSSIFSAKEIAQSILDLLL